MALSDTKIVPAGDRFDINTDMTSGLSLRVAGGTLLNGLGLKSVANTTLTLTASSTNYVEMDDNGVVTSNTTGFTSGSTSLYIVTTGATVITGVADFRASAWAIAALDGEAAKLVADKNVVGGVPVVFRIDLAAGALADTDVVMTHKVRVIDCYLILRGAGVGSTTLQVKNTASAISSLMAASGSDQALVRTTSIDDAAYEIAAGGTLRVTSASGATQPAATVYVTCLRVV